MITISNVEHFKEEIKSITNNINHNLYLINSEQLYFISAFIKIFKEKLPDELKTFNEYILYGDEINFNELLLKANNYPMMGDRQLFLVRDSNNLIKEIDKYFNKLKSIPKTSLIVLFINDPNISKKTKIVNYFKESGRLINFKKIYDNQLHNWVIYISSRYNFKLDYKTSQLIIELAGNNLSKINNEFEKLSLNKKDSLGINEELILNHFGINNEYNLFELQNQYGKRDLMKVLKISDHFSKNPKKYPVQVVLMNIYNYYLKIFQIQSLKKLSDSEVSKQVGINPFFLNEFKNASMNISMKETVKTLNTIKNYDLKSKGINTLVQDEKILKQLALEILG